ncbi:beta-xylosidase, partial [Rhizobium ruizarguesonis]
ATRDDKGFSILVWHYHDEDGAGPSADITVKLDGWGDKAASLRHFRMDEEHANAVGVWKTMGKQQNPAGEDYARLEA